MTDTPTPPPAPDVVMVPLLALPMRVDTPRPAWVLRLLASRRARWS